MARVSLNDEHAGRLEGPALEGPRAQEPARRSAAAAPIRICPGCGAIAPLERQGCDACQSSLAAPLSVDDPVDRFWVGVACVFTCNACRDLSPINYLATHGTVQCLRCGIDSRFEVESWLETLAFAQTVGDLCGPSPSGRFSRTALEPGINPYQSIGVARRFAENRGGPLDLVVRAIPGHPLCDACKQPLRIVPGAGPGLSVECPGCREVRTYSRPGAVAGPAWRALIGVMDQEHQAAGATAQVQLDESGGASLRCPNCAGNLDFDTSKAVVHCPYCKVAVRVPTHRLRGMGEKEPEALRWWLCLSGNSAERTRLKERTRELAQSRKQASDAEIFRRIARKELLQRSLPADAIQKLWMTSLVIAFSTLWFLLCRGVETLLVAHWPGGASDSDQSTIDRVVFMVGVAIGGVGLAITWATLNALYFRRADLQRWRRRLARLAPGMDVSRYLELLSDRREFGTLVIDLHFARPWGDAERRATVAARAPLVANRDSPLQAFRYGAVEPSQRPVLSAARWIDPSTLHLETCDLTCSERGEGVTTYSNRLLHESFVRAAERILSHFRTTGDAVSFVEVDVRGKVLPDLDT